MLQFKCHSRCFRMQLCSISLIWGMLLPKDLPWLSWAKFNASWALFIGSCIDSETCMIAKLESQLIRLWCHSPIKCINWKMTSFQPFWIINARIYLLWNELMSGNLSTVFLINSLLSAKHRWAKKIIMNSKGFHSGMGQPKNAVGFQFTLTVFRPLSIYQMTGEN